MSVYGYVKASAVHAAVWGRYWIAGAQSHKQLWASWSCCQNPDSGPLKKHPTSEPSSRPYILGSSFHSYLPIHLDRPSYNFLILFKLGTFESVTCLPAICVSLVIDCCFLSFLLNSFLFSFLIYELFILNIFLSDNNHLGIYIFL